MKRSVALGCPGLMGKFLSAFSPAGQNVRYGKHPVFEYLTLKTRRKMFNVELKNN